MNKNKVTVRIAGKEFVITSTDSSEYTRRVCTWVDTRMRELSTVSKLPASQLAVLTAVNAADDMMKSRDEILRLRKALEETRAELERLKNHENT